MTRNMTSEDPVKRSLSMNAGHYGICDEVRMWIVIMFKLSPRHRSIRKRNRRGAVAVEFAVVAPLFLLLLGGIIEFGLAFRIQHALSNASRRGARAAIFENANADTVKQLVRTHAKSTLGVADGDVTVAIAVNGVANASLSNTERGDAISVTVSIPYSKAGVGFYANTFSNATLSSTSVLERE